MKKGGASCDAPPSGNPDLAGTEARASLERRRNPGRRDPERSGGEGGLRDKWPPTARGPEAEALALGELASWRSWIPPGRRLVDVAAFFCVRYIIDLVTPGRAFRLTFMEPASWAGGIRRKTRTESRDFFLPSGNGVEPKEKPQHAAALFAAEAGGRLERRAALASWLRARKQILRPQGGDRSKRFPIEWEAAGFGAEPQEKG